MLDWLTNNELEAAEAHIKVLYSYTRLKKLSKNMKNLSQDS
jgi:hypothetical protein